MMLIIKVTLEKQVENHYLVFGFETEIKINLKSSDSDELKTFFGKLVSNLLDFDYDLSLEIKDIEEQLVVEVSTKYIEQLRTDISLIKQSEEYKLLKKY